MRLVHRDATEPALPEMAGAILARVDQSGVAAVQRRQRAAQTVGIRRDEDEVHMVRHQHPGPGGDALRPARRGEPVAVAGIVPLLEEDAAAAVAALGHVVGDAGNDETGEARHPAMLA